MGREIDFGYWRYSERDGRRGLVAWSEDNGKLYYNVPGDGRIRMVLGVFATADDVRAALEGWEDVCELETYEWVRERARGT